MLRHNTPRTPATLPFATMSASLVVAPGIVSLRKSSNHAPVARLDLGPSPMPPRLHDHLAADEHPPHSRSARHEDPGIEPLIVAPRREIGMALVEHHDIGAGAHRERADRPLQGLRTGREHGCEQPPSRRLALLCGHDVAGALHQPLAIFELLQLRRGVYLDVGVGADAESPPGGEIGGAIEDAVTERSL